jgi:hypothetical protein
MKKELEEFVSDGQSYNLWSHTWIIFSWQGPWFIVVISNRLTTSPCAVVADSYAWTVSEEVLVRIVRMKQTHSSSFFL